MDSHRVSIVGNSQQKGCLFVANNKVNTHLATEPKNFDIKVDGLNTGYVTCHRRRLRVCAKQLADKSTVQPVVRMQMISGFDVDNKLMKKVWKYTLKS